MIPEILNSAGLVVKARILADTKTTICLLFMFRLGPLICLGLRGFGLTLGTPFSNETSPPSRRLETCPFQWCMAVNSLYTLLEVVLSVPITMLCFQVSLRECQAWLQQISLIFDVFLGRYSMFGFLLDT